MLHQATANLQEKLAAPLQRIVSEHGHKIRDLLGSSAPLSASDETLRSVATFCYPLLPGVLRLVVKEAVFVDFILTHRHLLAPSAASIPAIAQ